MSLQKTFSWPHSSNRGETFAGWATESHQRSVSVQRMLEHRTSVTDGGCLLPTPTARDWRSGKASEATHARNSRPLSEVIGGHLNPEFVEYLMGFPIGFTACEHWETLKSPNVPRPHG